MTQSKPAGRRLLVFSVAIIALATLVPRGSSGGASGFCILCGTRGLSDFLSNILLFAPLGFALARRGHPLVRAAATGALFSLGIELAQMDLIGGRDANIGDLVANTIGTAAGWTLGFHRGWWSARTNDARRCLAVTSATLAVLLGGLALFMPSLPATPYYMQWTARFANMAAYEGRVLSTRLGPLELPGSTRIEQTDSVRGMLFEQPLEFTATAAVPRALAPIVSIYDEDQRQIMLLGAARADLVYRYRVIADELRLDHGDLRVHQAFEHVPAGSTYRLTWTVDRKGYCLDLEGRHECGRGFTVGDTWTLLMSLDWGTDERSVLRALWLWLVFLPAGLLAARMRTLAAAAGLTAITLIAGPLLLGFATTPLYQIIAAWIGLLTGSRRSARRRSRDTGMQYGGDRSRAQLHV